MSQSHRTDLGSYKALHQLCIGCGYVWSQSHRTDLGSYKFAENSPIIRVMPFDSRNPTVLIWAVTSWIAPVIPDFYDKLSQSHRTDLGSYKIINEERGTKAMLLSQSHRTDLGSYKHSIGSPVGVILRESQSHRTDLGSYKGAGAGAADAPLVRVAIPPY